jgi:hypothetical protein
MLDWPFFSMNCRFDIGLCASRTISVYACNREWRKQPQGMSSQSPVHVLRSLSPARRRPKLRAVDVKKVKARNGQTGPKLWLMLWLPAGIWGWMIAYTSRPSDGRDQRCKDFLRIWHSSGPRDINWPIRIRGEMGAAWSHLGLRYK